MNFRLSIILLFSIASGAVAAADLSAAISAVKPSVVGVGS
jgi:hypothetical protein